MDASTYFVGIGRNIMTPDQLATYDIDGLFVELSEGRGFDNEPLYGVTVVEPNSDYRDGYAPNLELGALFRSREAADRRVALLRAGQREFVERLGET